MIDRTMDALYMELLGQISTSWSGLPDKPEESPESTLRSLWHLAAGNRVTPVKALALPLTALDKARSCALKDLIEQRLGGVPLAYLIGRQTFLGMDLLCSPQAMIPRKETEIVGRAAVASVQALAREREAVRVIDLCTGSGNLAVLMAANEPRCQVWGVDITGEAVELARQNAAFLGLGERVHFAQGNLFAPLATAGFLHNTDLVTCNPPYISSAQVDKLPGEIHDYEPREAFDGGPFGIQVLTRLIREAPAFLKPGAWLCFEVGAGQGRYIANMLQKIDTYREIETFADETGEVRALRAKTVPTAYW